MIDAGSGPQMARWPPSAQEEPPGDLQVSDLRENLAKEIFKRRSKAASRIVERHKNARQNAKMRSRLRWTHLAGWALLAALITSSEICAGFQEAAEKAEPQVSAQPQTTTTSTTTTISASSSSSKPSAPGAGSTVKRDLSLRPSKLAPLEAPVEVKRAAPRELKGKFAAHLLMQVTCSMRHKPLMSALLFFLPACAQT